MGVKNAGPLNSTACAVGSHVTEPFHLLSENVQDLRFEDRLPKLDQFKTAAATIAWLHAAMRCDPSKFVGRLVLQQLQQQDAYHEVENLPMPHFSCRNKYSRLGHSHHGMSIETAEALAHRVCQRAEVYIIPLSAPGGDGSPAQPPLDSATPRRGGPFRGLLSHWLSSHVRRGQDFQGDGRALVNDEPPCMLGDLERPWAPGPLQLHMLGAEGIGLSAARIHCTYYGEIIQFASILAQHSPSNR